MLSNELLKMIEELKMLESRVDKKLREETDGRFSYCCVDYSQLYADHESVHDKAVVEEVFGELVHKNRYDDYDSYWLNLGNTKGVILLPISMSDSRSESDDVRANQEA